MKTEKEIRERIGKLKSYLEVLGDLGRLSNRDKYAMTKEIKILEWALGIKEVKDKKEMLYFTPVTDKIIEVLRDNPKGLTANEINFKLERDYSEIDKIRMLLQNLYKKGKIKRRNKEVSKYKPQIYVLNEKFR